MAIDPPANDDPPPPSEGWLSRWLAKIFGANWQTTVYGGLRQVFSALVTGTLAFPTDWTSPKQIALFIGVLIMTFLGIKFAFVVKDRNVVGGSSQQSLEGNLIEPGRQNLVDATKIASPVSEQRKFPEVKR